jgi:hypothetical protein
MYQRSVISPRLAHPGQAKDFVMEISTEDEFSQAERNESQQLDAVFNFPVYLEPDVSAFLHRLAEQKKVDVQDLVNDLLRKDIQLIQSVQ